MHWRIEGRWQWGLATRPPLKLVKVQGRDGSNPEAKDSNPNPNHFILLESESESESTQVCNGFES